LTPNADGALHHVVQSVASDAGNELLLSNQEQVNEDTPIGQLLIPADSSDTPANPSILPATATQATEVATPVTQIPTILISSSELLVEQAGAGRLRLQGTATVQWAAGELSGTIGAASQLRISNELTDSEGRQRLDGLLVIDSADFNEPLELRIAGFVADDGQASQLSGVYRLSSPVETLLQTDGQIEGEIQLPSQENIGSLELTLQK